ncbi:MAG: RagB/SusD family nutrient uptake outer membrane protein [Bacteroidales bacterium]|nr:RagB/SusD family nutrient uptake outer membrane protein [Bacteroidales bacterium]
MNKIIIYIAFIATGLFLSACSEEFLDRKPLDQEVSSNFYQTEDQAYQALVAIYDALGYQSSPDVAWAPFLTVSDILSDDAFAGGADANDGKQHNELDKFNILTSNTVVHSLWVKNYVGIYRANLYLEKIEEMSTTDEFKSRTIAEAKFMRAYFYFELVRFFENIPLLTETIKSTSEYTQEQNTPEEVYNQIALDLTGAIADLPEAIPVSEGGRISKWAAQGLLARAYLFYKGVYGKELQANGTEVNQSVVLGHLEDLILRSGHDLFTNYEDNFKLVGEFGVESVFEISHGDSPAWWDWNYVRGGNGNLAAQMQGPRVTNSDNWDRGWSFGTVSHKLAQDLTGDPRFSHTILTEDELDGKLVKGYQHTGYYSKKYSSDAEHWSADGQFELNRTCNFRVIRYSDILLMAAELGSPNAQQYLDKVRARVGLASVPATLENILKERRLELSLEGVRYFDVLRQGLSVAQQEFTVTGVRGPNYIGDQLLFDATFNAATKGFLPIPQTEVDLSGGAFVKNNGY